MSCWTLLHLNVIRKLTHSLRSGINAARSHCQIFIDEASKDIDGTQNLISFKLTIPAIKCVSHRIESNLAIIFMTFWNNIL